MHTHIQSPAPDAESVMHPIEKTDFQGQRHVEAAILA